MEICTSTETMCPSEETLQVIRIVAHNYHLLVSLQHSKGCKN